MTATLIVTAAYGGPEWNQDLAANEQIAAILGLIPDPSVAASKFVSTLRQIHELLGQINVTTDLGSPDSAGVAVRFIVPGSVTSPDFEGCRAGRVTKAEREMVVDVAVPVATALSQKREDAVVFLQDSLLEAVNFADHHFKQRGVVADFSRVRSIGLAVRTATSDVQPG